MLKRGFALERGGRVGTFARVLVLASVLVVSKKNLYARESTDVVVLNNGDRLTCTIKRLEGGVLFVGLDYADGDVSIDWTKVARINSKQLFIVKTQDGLVITGKLATYIRSDVKRAKVQVAETDEKLVVIDKTQIVDVRQTSEEFVRRFSGGISLGYAYSKGNNATQYNLGFQTTYQRERWSAQTNVSSNLSANSGAETSTRNAVSLGSYHLLPWDNYFYGGLGNFLQSSVQGIQLQTSLGGGIGRFLKNTNRSRIALLGGMAWQITNYHQTGIPQPTENVAAALIALDISLFRFSKTNLKVLADVFPALSDPGRVRFNTNVSYFVKLFGDISWTVTFYGNWDTRPPFHFSGSDYGSTTGLSWDFGK